MLKNKAVAKIHGKLFGNVPKRLYLCTVKQIITTTMEQDAMGLDPEIVKEIESIAKRYDSIEVVRAMAAFVATYCALTDEKNDKSVFPTIISFICTYYDEARK